MALLRQSHDHRQVRLLLVLALVAGCGSSKSAEPAPAPAPAPVPAPRMTVTVGRDAVTIGTTPVPDRDGDIDRGTLEAALHGRTDTVPLAIAPDAPYGRLLAVTDLLFGLGLDGELDVGRGSPQPALRPQAATGALDDTPILVLSVSTDAIYLGATQVARLADLPPGDDIPALADAIGTLASRPSRLVLQADRATPGALVVRVIGTARRAGVPDVAFALHIAEPPAPPPIRAPVR
jgi:biopolymer transport protein ExbD